MYKPLADSTLMGMTKKEIIEHLRIAEHNHRVCEEQIDQQYKNCIKLLADERAEVLDEVTKEIEFEEKWLSDAIREDKGNYGYNIDIAFSGIKNSLKKLKEQK